MKYFENESEVLTLLTDSGVQLENHIDSVSFTGDIDITCDEKGLALVHELLSHLSNLEAQMAAKKELGTLPAVITNIKPQDAGNVFGLPELKD